MYKKLLLVLLSIITIQAAKAQTEKGSQNLGATFGVSTTSSTIKDFNASTNSYGNDVKGKITSYTIMPSYSYFIADKLDIGIGLGYGYNHSKSEPNDNYSNSTNRNYFGIISLRKYFLFDNKIGIRTGPYLNYERTKSSYAYTSNSGSYNRDTYGGGLSMDFVYYPAKKIGIAAGLANLGYSHQKNTGSSVGTTNTFNLTFVDNLALSVYYVFGK
jgi:hypothetical protein